MTGERPDGAISGLLWEYDQQLNAARTHAAAEGHSPDTLSILDSYDRTLHPWMHGRRPADLADAIAEWWGGSE